MKLFSVCKTRYINSIMSVCVSEILSVTNRMCLIVKKLSELYEFDYNESLEFLSLEDSINNKKQCKKTDMMQKERSSSSIPLPFCGIIFEECCKGIKLNHGLYTQCQSKPVNGDFCKVCFNQTQKNSSNKPTYGIITDRLVGDLENFKDPKGKKVVSYGNVMEKLNISREMAEAAAQKINLTIPEEQFRVIRNQRGRPKKTKDVSVDDTDSEKSFEKEKRPRGRPKKDVKESKAKESDNIIANLLANANIDSDKIDFTGEILDDNQSGESNEIVNKALKDNVASKSNESDDSDSEEINVTIFKHNGKEYFKSEDNILYDKNSNIVGKWNPIGKKIETATLYALRSTH